MCAVPVQHHLPIRFAQWGDAAASKHQRNGKGVKVREATAQRLDLDALGMTNAWARGQREAKRTNCTPATWRTDKAPWGAASAGERFNRCTP
ncbi:hypothetical protein A7H73_23355 [Salmonella enterica subsp. enterica serovar Senftenberg]|nr:hypothetical protein [Salmonella enterica subsp. enterica serovar Senftenberg]